MGKFTLVVSGGILGYPGVSGGIRVSGVSGVMSVPFDGTTDRMCLWLVDRFSVGHGLDRIVQLMLRHFGCILMIIVDGPFVATHTLSIKQKHFGLCVRHRRHGRSIDLRRVNMESLGPTPGL